LAGTRDVSVCKNIQTSPGTHAPSSSMDNEALYQTIHLHLVLRLIINNEWSYTSTSPACFCDMDRDNFTFHHERFSQIPTQYDDDDDDDDL
jgi:hypothetical protein